MTIRIRKLRLGIGIMRLSPKMYFVGLRYEWYGGDFWRLGFWFFQVYASKNPYFWLSRKEIERGVQYEVFKETQRE